jgi:hypothetical protein
MQMQKIKMEQKNTTQTQTQTYSRNPDTSNSQPLHTGWTRADSNPDTIAKREMIWFDSVSDSMFSASGTKFEI